VGAATDLPSRLTGRNQYCLDEEGRGRTLNRGRGEKGGDTERGRFCQKVRDGMEVKNGQGQKKSNKREISVTMLLTYKFW
jgi:hypothetical protein